MMIRRRADNPGDPYQPKYELVGDSGVVIRTFEKRDSALEYRQYLEKQRRVENAN